MAVARLRQRLIIFECYVRRQDGTARQRHVRIIDPTPSVMTDVYDAARGQVSLNISATTTPKTPACGGL